MPRRLAKPAWRCARSRAAFRFLVWRRARLASPRSGFYLCSCQLVLSLGIRLRNSSQPDHPMLSLYPLHTPTLGDGWLGRRFSILRMESEEVGHHDRLDLPTGLAGVPPEILPNPENR